jgi:hypothetical protein
MDSPECDLKGHGLCSGPICQRGMTLNYRCDAHVILEAYWSKRNPGKKLKDWLAGLQNAEREEVLRKASPRGKHWMEVRGRPLEESEEEGLDTG